MRRQTAKPARAHPVFCFVQGCALTPYTPSVAFKIPPLHHNLHHILAVLSAFRKCYRSVS